MCIALSKNKIALSDIHWVVLRLPIGWCLLGSLGRHILYRPKASCLRWHNIYMLPNVYFTLMHCEFLQIDKQNIQFYKYYLFNIKEPKKNKRETKPT